MVFNTYKQLSKSEIKMLSWLRPGPANLRAQLFLVHADKTGTRSFFLSGPSIRTHRPSTMEAAVHGRPHAVCGPKEATELAVGCPSANNAV